MRSFLSSTFRSFEPYISGSKSSVQETENYESSPDLNPNREDCIRQLCDIVKEKSEQLPETEPLPVYKIPLEEKQITAAGCRLYSFGKEYSKRNRTIMILGATGAGKSTLINGMINYILGVEWECPYRFKLVHEDPAKSQAESQTSEVTVYKINHQTGFKIDHSVTIIDTPGFGDTRGIERDREIVEQLKNLFSDPKLGVNDIHAVCFVAQASLARLTPSQKYVFDSVLSIFGKDIAENIRILVTFADGQRPPVLEAINKVGVPCPKTKNNLPDHFKFNNSALFAQNKSSEAHSSGGDDEDGSFDEMFWKMGTKSMKRFFNALKVIEAKSLTMTKDVLKERERLETSVEGLQEQVKLGLAKLEEINETAEKIKAFEAEISRNENFEFEITVQKPFQQDISGTGNYLTNCQVCHFTCHYPCGILNDADKSGCAAMGSDGNCKVCPGRCYWKQHFNQKYKWEYKEVKEKQTIQELKKKYDIAKSNKSPVEALVRKLRAEYHVVQTEVEKLIEESAECLTKLREIALRPNPLSTPDYIDMLIEGEKSEAKEGWNKRVQSLMNIKQTALTVSKVASGKQLLPPPGSHQNQPKNDSNQDEIHKNTCNEATESEPNSDNTKPDSGSGQCSASESDKDQKGSISSTPDLNKDQDTNQANQNTIDNQDGDLYNDQVQEDQKGSLSSTPDLNKDQDTSQVNQNTSDNQDGDLYNDQVQDKSDQEQDTDPVNDSKQDESN